MKYLIVICFLVVIPSKGNAQEDRTMAFGIEQDVLPYILKGYFGSLWYGNYKWRLRGSYAVSQVPNFGNESLNSDRVQAAGLSFEMFFKEQYKGWWFGPGIGYWRNNIKFNSGQETINESIVLTIGGGYNWVFWKGFYISPWMAMHFRTTGFSDINILNESYSPWPVTPEVSLKVGYRFLLK